MQRRIVSRIVSSILIVALFIASIAPGFVLAQAMESVPEGSPVVEVGIPETDHSDTVTKNEVKEALLAVPEVLQESDELTVSRDADSAMIVESEHTSVDIPKKPEDGVTLSLENGTSIDIALPNADEAKNAKRVAPGIVAYAGNDGSANAVQADESGGVRMLTIIDNVNAPMEYEYTVTVPSGGRIELTSEGGAVVLDGNAQPIVSIGTPWAKDATGISVDTWFTTDGLTLQQHVLHTVSGVTYPVTADPFIWRWNGFTYEFNRSQTNNLMLGMGIAAAPALYIPDPTVSKIAAAVLIVSTSYTNWVYNRGGCVKISANYFPRRSAFLYGYYGGNCR